MPSTGRSAPPGPARPTGRCAALEDVLRYLDSQRNWLGDYGAWQAAGNPIGSGMVERAVELVINRRLKRRGGRRRRTHVVGVVTLRVRRINDDWDACSAA